MRTAYKYQLKPSKWPLSILSPMGEGALRGRPASGLRVADRFGLRGDGLGNACGTEGLTALLGGAFGIWGCEFN